MTCSEGWLPPKPKKTCKAKRQQQLTSQVIGYCLLTWHVTVPGNRVNTFGVGMARMRWYKWWREINYSYSNHAGRMKVLFQPAINQPRTVEDDSGRWKPKCCTRLLFKWAVTSFWYCVVFLGTALGVGWRCDLDLCNVDTRWWDNDVLQRQTTVTTYFSSGQLLPFGFGHQSHVWEVSPALVGTPWYQTEAQTLCPSGALSAAARIWPRAAILTGKSHTGGLIE